MTVLPVMKMGRPILRERAVEVADPSDPQIAALAADMIETMEAEEGIGIAAPQVDVPLRLIVVLPIVERAQKKQAPPEPLVVINPEIVPLGDELVDGVEGCLSIPGLRGDVPRYRRIRWSGFGLDGQAIGGEAGDLVARVFQHEVDHLDGVLYLDRMRDLRSLGFVDALEGEDGQTPDDPAERE